jgi:shikimate dehydrogenase
MKRKFGLIGLSLGHSFSQRFFTEKFSKEGIAAEYINFELENITQLPHLVGTNPELVGINVTIPYKEQVIRFLNHIDETAADITWV